VTAISAVLITLNEEQRLKAALESVAFCDEVLVVDSGSTDGTRAIAEAAGARFIVNIPWPGFVAQKNLAARQARHDWILSLDADERVAPVLRDEIQALRGRGLTYAGYRIPRVAHYLGTWIRATDWYPDPQLRLFDRRCGGWQGGRVHESVRLDGPVGRLKAPLEHHPYADIAEHLRTIDRYTTLWAEQASADGRRVSTLGLAGSTAWAFLRNVLLRRGFLLGRTGLIVSMLNSYYTFLKLAKLHERTSLGRDDG
jgi:glycosyltransferase involved in cell wall biosynthesis